MTHPVSDHVDDLTRALRAVLEFCDTNHGYNLPDLLSSALVTVAYERGGSHALISHRPGSWEATHVQALAAEADYQLDLDHEQDNRETP